MAALSIRSLSKRYANLEVLKGIDLDIESGEFTVLVGPSGCGKSTLLRAIAGLEEIDAGTIEIDGEVVNEMRPRDRDVAMVFQDYALYPHMTAFSNIGLSLRARGVPKAEIATRVGRVAEMLGISALLERYPRQLSGGQRQRVAMGRALVRDPKLFLFDEPLSNLDAKLRVDMRTEIKKLHLRVGKTTIYVTHDQIEAMTLASRIAVMHQGAIQQFDEPQAVYDRPANIFVAGFMGSPSMNFIPGELTKLDGRPAVRIALGQGETAALPLPQTPASVPTNGKVVLGVRPEHLFRYDPSLKAQKAGLAMLTAPVEVVEPTGAETHAVLKVGEQEIVGRFDPDGAPRLGELLPLGIDMSHACLFDPETQALIPQVDA
jgi:multiple sugar transport system ATP-binding protein